MLILYRWTARPVRPNLFSRRINGSICMQTCIHIFVRALFFATNEPSWKEDGDVPLDCALQCRYSKQHVLPAKYGEAAYEVGGRHMLPIRACLTWDHSGVGSNFKYQKIKKKTVEKGRSCSSVFTTNTSD